MDVSENFGANVKRLRLRHEWSQARLAEAAGVSQQAVSEVERAEQVPSLEVAAKLALALDTTVQSLMAAPPPGFASSASAYQR